MIDDWASLWELDGGWALSLLEAINGDLFAGTRFDPWQPDTWDGNPINRILESDELWELVTTKVEGINGMAMARAQIICQQIIWSHDYYSRGPEGDGQAKSLRKLWYAGHKDALQRVSRRLDVWRQDSGVMDDTAANAAMGQAYAGFVDTRAVTYLDLWVKDTTSRRFEKIERYDALPAPFGNTMVCIEKDAAYDDCVLMAKALGARVALSGKGKMGRAALEHLLRTCFSDRYETDRPGGSITSENPLRLLVFSDWDYDGEAVIAPTFARQVERYVNPHLIQWVRIGVTPDQVEELYDLQDASYQAKFTVNSAYTSWCHENAVFFVGGQTYHGAAELTDETVHKRLVQVFQQYPPHGFELDALKRVEYAPLLLRGFLSLVSWDDFLAALSKKAWPQPSSVVGDLAERLLQENQLYRGLETALEELEETIRVQREELEAVREEMRSRAEDILTPEVEDWLSDSAAFEPIDPTPSRGNCTAHLRQQEPWGHWQPYRQYQRREFAVEQLATTDVADEVRQMTNE